MKSLPVLKKELQKIFNSYIRLRDSVDGTYFKCISCNKIKPISSMDAGHYYSTGYYDGLRYDEDNCHGQCRACNTFLHGNLIEYQENLIKKIGIERFEKLKIRAGYYKRYGNKFSRYELQMLISLYKKKIAELNEH